LIKSPEYIRELQKLQDEVGTFDNEIALQIIKEELGRDANELFDFNPILPIASASIGQVYKARLRATNETVAVKVQRPDAIKTAALDMFILRKLAAIVKKRRKIRTNLVGIVDVFGSQLFQEMNYIQEAKNGLRFKELYGTIPGISVPEAYVNLTTRKVLVMEFAEGVKGPWAVGGERMLTLGLQCSVLQLLGTGFFHSDPHRGNLLQSPNGELVYLDFGMMAEVPAEQRFALIGTVLGLVNRDIPLVIKSLKDLDFFPPETDEAVVVSALTNAVMDATQGGEGSTLNFTRLSSNINSVSYKLPFRLPPFYSFIIRTLTILEGLALYVDPSFRLVRGAYPFIAKQILTDPSPELVNLLKSILINPADGSIRWDKLEQFISIASNADAAVAGDFSKLKVAQDRSDLIKTYSGIPQTEGNFTFDVTLQIMDFILSEKGSFLLEPLVEEIVDTIDSLGLSAAALSSIATNGLLPAPNEKPDKKRIERFANLMRTLFADANVGDAPSSHRNSRHSDDHDSNRGGSGVRPNVLNTLQKIFAILTDVLQSEKSAKLQPILGRSAVVARQVAGRLAERNTRRTVRRLMNPSLVEATLPFVGRTLDLFLSPPRSRKR
jgi:predicted unusual protein kinase regulating ubiquinone biosynthesis (AarF/ABC1/UbiB family)